MTDIACILSFSRDSTSLTISQVLLRMLSNPTRHFWYSKGSFSSTYLLIFLLASFLRNRLSELMVAILTWSIRAIADWFRPSLDNSKTLFLRHCRVSRAFLIKSSAFHCWKYYTFQHLRLTITLHYLCDRARDWIRSYRIQRGCRCQK